MMAKARPPTQNLKKEETLSRDLFRGYLTERGTGDHLSRIFLPATPFSSEALSKMRKFIPRFITNFLARARTGGQPLPQPAVAPPPPEPAEEQEWVKRIRRINDLCERRKQEIYYDQQRPN